MFVSEGLEINAQNHLTIGGCDCVKLVEKYKTPLYVLDEEEVRKNCRIYKNAIDRFYDGNGLIFYASKALCIKEMVRLVKEEGLGIDVVSGGELYTALHAGMPAEKICMHGNNKTDEELLDGMRAGVGRIVVDSTDELHRINQMAKEMGRVQKILVRVKPGIDAHTHSFIMTGQIDSKFGVALETGEAALFVKTAKDLENINLAGVHCHIGSQIFELNPFCEAAKVLVDFMGEMKKEYNFQLTELNLGGGFGVKYTEADDPVEFDQYIQAVSVVVKETAEKWGIHTPFIMMEPGRSIVATAGITLYKVGGVKEIPNVRTYISVDGGMGDNPRYILYQSEYDMILANRANAVKDKAVTVAGKCCESGDLLAEHVKLPADVKRDDLLAVFTTGAYNYSMSSNYNRIPRPPMVFVKNGKDRVVVKRETYEDIIRNDI